MGPGFLNTLGWWQWALLGLIPPAIVALYFLKLRREPLEVPSTYLWQKSIEDLHVNSIWQRLRRNLLLLLQLLIVLLAMFALLRPGCRGTTLTGDRFVFLLDQSASMAATDVAPTRLEEAKRRVLALIDQMSSGSKAMVIGFADTAHVVQQFTDNRRLLRQQVRGMKPTAGGTSLLGALQLAAGLANPGRIATEAGDTQVADPLPATLYVLSDGGFDDAETRDFSLGNLAPVFVPIGRPDAANVAITALSSRPDETDPAKRQVFARLENFGGKKVTAAVELYLNDQLVDADEVALDGGQAGRLVFDLVGVDSGRLRLDLRPDDALPLDNVAHAVVNPARRGRVLLVSPGNETIWWALITDRARQIADAEQIGPEQLPAYRDATASGTYDLVIYDRCQPAALPRANTVFIGALPPGDAWQSEPISAPQIIDTDLSHPIMHLVQLDDILIGRALALTPPAGSTVLIDSNRGPLCAINPREGYEDLVLGFEIVHAADGRQELNTNWPVGRLSFPSFLLNVLQYFAGDPVTQSAANVRPGQPVALKGSGSTDRLGVRLPDGTSREVLPDRHGKFLFRATGQIGVYQVRESGQTTYRFPVNLFSSSESNIASRPDRTIQVGYVDVEGQVDWEPARRELWKPILLVALGVLLFEWYIYNRRIYI